MQQCICALQEPVASSSEHGHVGEGSASRRLLKSSGGKRVWQFKTLSPSRTDERQLVGHVLLGQAVVQHRHQVAAHELHRDGRVARQVPHHPPRRHCSAEHISHMNRFM